MKNKISQLLNQLLSCWPYFFIALVGLIIVFQYKSNTLYYYWDQYFPLNINDALKNYHYVWHNESGFGNYDTGSLNLLVYIGFIKLISLFTSNIYLIQKILYYLIFCLSTISFYYLLNVIFAKNKNKILVFAALFYSLNIFSLVYIWRMNLSSIFLYAFLPLAFGAYIDLLNKKSFKNIILLLVSFALMIPAFGHPAYIITTWFLFISYSLFRAIVGKSVEPLLTFMIVILSWVILNLWWIYSMLINSGTTLELSGNNALGTAIVIYYTTSSHNLWQNVVRLLGEWHLYDYHFGVKDFPWLSAYTTKSLFSIVSYLLSLILFVAMLIRQKQQVWQKEKTYFVIIFFISLLLIIGPNLNENAFIWLFSHSTLFRMFRNSYEKIGILLSMSVSFVVAYLTNIILLSQINNRLKKIIISAYFIILLVIIPLPFYINKIYPTGNTGLPSSLVSIPDKYVQIKNLLNNNEKSFIFPFQDSPLQSAKNGSNSYVGVDMLRNLSLFPIISTVTGIQNNDKIAKEISLNLENSSDKNYIVRLFNFFQIRYLINDPNIMDLSKISDGEYRPYNKSILVNLSVTKNVSGANFYDFASSENKSEIYIAKNPIFLPSDQITSIFSLLKYKTTDNIYLLNNINKSLNTLPNSMVLDVNEARIEDAKLIFNLNNFKQDDYSVKLALNEKTLGKNDKIKNLIIDDKNIEVNSPVNNGVVNVGDSKFNSGSTIGVGTTSSNVSIINSSFEKDLWQCIDISPANPGKADFSCNKSIDRTNGNYSAKLVSKNHILGMRQKIKLDKNKIYELSFDYKYISGGLPYFVIEYLDPTNDSPVSENSYNLSDSGDWKGYRMSFQPKTEEIYLYFYSNPNFGQAEINIDNVKLKEIDTGFIKNIIIDSKDPRNSSTNIIPEISFKKINPTKYEVNIINAKSPYFLNLLQSYNQNWKVFDKNGKKLILEDNHFVSDGYANSWQINKLGTYKLFIEFDTQIKVGRIIFWTTVFAILIILILAIINFRKKCKII